MSPAPRRPQATTRGFSLIEIVIVVVIIGVFAAMAIPQVTRQMRDRRVRETAQRVANLYREARLRAMGRGGAVMVQYDGSGNGAFTVSERRLGAATVNGSTVCQFLPNPSCTDWANTTGTDSLQLTSLVPETSASGDVVIDVLRHDNGSDTALMDLCFTPMGRTYFRYSASDQWEPLNDVPVANVARKLGTGTIGLTREVLILPNGSSRLAL